MLHTAATIARHCINELRELVDEPGSPTQCSGARGPADDELPECVGEASGDAKGEAQRKLCGAKLDGSGGRWSRQSTEEGQEPLQAFSRQSTNNAEDGALEPRPLQGEVCSPAPALQAPRWFFQQPGGGSFLDAESGPAPAWQADTGLHFAVKNTFLVFGPLEPPQVLNQFLQSFSIVHHLSPSKTETQVLEEYLVWRWENHQPPLGPTPTGHSAIARMRLIMMGQGDSEALLRGFDGLTEEDQLTLSEELARTGCRGQSYTRYVPQDATLAGMGPALLIYYAPALLQNAGKDNPRVALIVLAEIMRQSRALWPFSKDQGDDTVTLRIDALKVLDLTGILAVGTDAAWVLAKKSGKEGAVQLLPLAKVNETDWTQNRILSFNDDEEDPVVVRRRSSAKA